MFKQQGSVVRPPGLAGIDRLVLGVLTVAGAAVRLRYALVLPMRTDEAFTYNEYASRSLDELFRYTFPNNHPLNSLLIHLATARLGMAPWVIRLPALIAGVLLIPATYAMVHRLAGRPAALAAALVAGSSPLIGFSANGRGYTLLALCATGLAAAAARLVADGGRPRDWVAFTLLGPLGFFALPVMVYPFGGVVLWMILARLAAGGRAPRLDRLGMALLLAGSLTVVLYLPVLGRSGLGSVVGNRFVAPRPWPAVLAGLPGSLLGAWRMGHADLPRPLAPGMAAGALLACGRSMLGRGRGGRLCGLTATVLGWSVAVCLVQRVVPPERVWVFLVPFSCGCVACGLDGLLGDRPVAGAGLALGVGLGLMMLVGWGGAVRRDAEHQALSHAEAISRDLGARLLPEDGVVVAPASEAPLKYEFLAAGVPVEHLYDYRIAAARRLYLVVDRRTGQTPESVLAECRIKAPPGAAPGLVRRYSSADLYMLERR